MRFKDSWLRIQRAKKHFEELRAELAGFAKTEPYVFTKDRDTKTGEYVCRAVVREEPWQSISVIAGDIAHSLRSSLNYLAWEVVATDKRRKNKDVEFPICKKRTTFLNSRTGRHFAAISPPAFACLKRLQPFNARYSAEAKLLRDLHRLDVEDKHHRIALTAAIIYTPDTYMTFDGPTRFRVTEDALEGVIYKGFKSGAVIFRLSELENPDVEVKGKIMPKVGFAGIPSAKGQPVDKFLDSLYTLTSNIFFVLGKLLP